MTPLTKGELHHGAEYIGASRSGLSARWDNNLAKFKIMGFKFGYFFIEEIPHFDDAPPGEDSFRPYCPLVDVPERLTNPGI